MSARASASSVVVSRCLDFLIFANRARLVLSAISLCCFDVGAPNGARFCLRLLVRPLAREFCFFITQEAASRTQQM